MRVTYIHHSCFLVETDSFYYLFDYEKGCLPEMNVLKPIFVLSSHGHADHYNSKIFSLLAIRGMKHICGILSEDIKAPEKIKTLQVSPEMEYEIGPMQKLITFQSTDLGVAFLIKDHQQLIYHAGDLNDWVWEEESDFYNEQMTINYQRQIQILSKKINHQAIDVAFIVLDPRQEKDYDKGLCYFLEHISVKQVYPMHYWGMPSIIEKFLKEHPQYKSKIRSPE